MDHPPRQALEKLLLSLFSGPELRRFIRGLPGGDEMSDALPGDIASPSVLVHEALSVLERHGRIDAHFFESLLEERPGRRDEIQALAARMSGAAALGPPDEWLLGLPEPLHARLVGRERELEELDAAWRDPGTRVLSIVAWGGAGKSTLVHHWLGRMREAGWRGARKIYGWSFYAQGTHDTNVSSEAFFAEALAFFGDPGAMASPPQARVRRLVQLILQQPTLLVLDGLEPLQEPPHDLGPGAKVRDPSLSEFLRALAQGMDGLCLVTSRLQVKDLASQRHGAPVLALEQLGTTDGAALLRDLGVHGSEAELCKAADEMKGHALALMLLGKYLHAVRGGDIGRRHDISMLAAADAVHGGKLERIMAAYDEWLQPRSRAVMRLVSLFDRPADDAALAALRSAPAIPGLTDALVDAGPDDWLLALHLLREAGLLAPGSPQQPGPLDAHPLVRAYFSETLRREQPEAWRAAHARLYEHYLDTADGQPSDLAELGRLVDAVIHGCHAGQYSEVYREVYSGRIHGKDGYKWVTRLGAFGLELSALAAFMNHRWDRPVDALERAAQADVLEVAGYNLLALGRLTEALEPTRIALQLDVADERWDPASVDASLLAQIELLLGHLDAAQQHARTAVELAGKKGFPERLMTTRTLLGEVLQCAGKFAESQAHFDEAEELQRQHWPSQSQLVALPGARYCALLLDLATPLDGSALNVEELLHQRLAEAQQRCADMHGRAERLLRRSEERGYTRFTLGMHRSILGQAHLGLWLAARGQGMPAEAPDVVAHRNQAEAALDQAVDELRQSGRNDALPRALLARAGLHRFLEDRASAALDLAEVEELAERSGMRLLACDAHLERARLSLASGDATAAREHTETARTIITETGYRRREHALVELDAVLSRTQ